jgi:hypothetical protein
MPGYWNRDDSKERATGAARAERRQEERQGGGGQDRFSQQAQQAAEQRYQAQQLIDEKRDYYDPTWAKEDRTKTAGEYYGDVQGSVNLGKALKNIGISKDQLQRYIDAGILPENVALELGLVKPGEHWDPRGKFTEDMKLGLEEQQFALDEGVYGGVSGYEAEVNKLKEQALTGNKEEKKAAYKALDRLTGSQKNTDYILSEFGYDPTGVHTFSDIESDPNLYNKYLSRGTLYDDPLSGILKPRGPQFTGGGDWGYSSYSGSGGGGRGSGLPPIPEGQVWQESPWGQSQIQQQFIDQQMGFANRNRGGIVSLLGDY